MDVYHLQVFSKYTELRIIESCDYKFQPLTGQDKLIIMQFLTSWCLQHGDLSYHLEEEIKGITYILEHIDVLGSKVARIFIQGRLEAITIVSLINNNEAEQHK